MDQRSKLAMGGVIAAVALFAQFTMAGQTSGLYVSAGGGMNERTSADDELAEARFEKGYLWSIAVGERLSDSKCPLLKDTRIELEYTHQYNNLDTLYLHPSATVHREEQATGSIDHESVLGLLYYDIPLTAKFKPYIGGGMGFGRSMLKELATPTLVAYGGAPGAYPLSTTTGWEFAYSARAGVSWEFSDRMTFFIGGRYHKVRDVTVESPASLTEVGVGSTMNNATHPPVEMWIGEFGIRYTL